MTKQKLSTEAKVQKEFPEFADEVATLSVDQLNARLAQLAKDGEAVEDAKEADDGLQEAKETAKELAAPYRDAKKAIRLKSRYVIKMVKEKGGK